MHRGRVFISYCSEDRETAALVQKAIAKQLGPQSVFWDLQVMAMEDWLKVLGTEIDDCIALVLILSESWKERFLTGTSRVRTRSGPVKQTSAFVDKEWETANFLQKPIIPVVIGEGELFRWFSEGNHPNSIANLQKLHVPNLDPEDIERRLPNVVCRAVAQRLWDRLVPALATVTMLVLAAMLTGWGVGWVMAGGVSSSHLSPSVIPETPQTCSAVVAEAPVIPASPTHRVADPVLEPVSKTCPELAPLVCVCPKVPEDPSPDPKPKPPSNEHKCPRYDYRKSGSECVSYHTTKCEDYYLK